MEDSNVAKEIAELVLGVGIGLVTWLLDKIGIDMPKPVYFLVLFIALFLICWALANLGWLSRIPYLKEKQWAVSSVLIWVIGSLCSILLIGQYYFKPSNYEYMDIQKLQRVDNPRPFVNETVEIDGKDFENCSFYNVRFVYQGTRNAAFLNNHFYGTIVISTSVPNIAAFTQLLGIFGTFAGTDHGVQLESTRNSFTVFRRFAAGTERLPDTGPK